MRKGDHLATFMCQVSRNPGSLNLLESYGTVHACTGTALLNQAVDMGFQRQSMAGSNPDDGTDFLRCLLRVVWVAAFALS